MSNVPLISMDELESQLRELEGRQPEGFSIEEMSDRTGRSAYWCRAKLKKLVDEGKAKYNGKRAGTMLDGRRYHAPVYVLVGGSDGQL